jgi:hypothetical protein
MTLRRFASERFDIQLSNSVITCVRYKQTRVITPLPVRLGVAGLLLPSVDP